MSQDSLRLPVTVNTPISLYNLPSGSSAGDILKWDGTAWQVTQLYPYQIVNFSPATGSSDIYDIGFYGSYVSSSRKYTGLFRDATDGIYKLFTELLTAPASGVVPTGSLTYADLSVNSIYLNAGTASQDVILDSSKKMTTAARTTIAGTENQIYVNGTYGSGQTGVLTLTLPQAIETSSFARFGRLGLGVSPSYALHISGFFIPQVVIDTTNTTSETQHMINSVLVYKTSVTATGTTMGTVTNTSLQLITNNTARVTVTGTGDVTTTGYVAAGVPICGQVYGLASTSSYGTSTVKFVEPSGGREINNMTASTGRLTVSIAGIYKASFSTSVSQSSGSDKRLRFYMYIGGTENSGPYETTLVTGKTYLISFVDLLNLSPTDYAEIYVESPDGTVSYSWNAPSLTIHRL